MKIKFELHWVKQGAAGTKSFKSEAAAALFWEYLDRISKFVQCSIGGKTSAQEKNSGSAVWICHSAHPAREYTSEAVAKQLTTVRDSGVRELRILIGGADGFSKQDLENCKPQLVWSFGPLTLPHELAAVVAAEQIYRAWTIIKGMPYHLGHK